MNMTQTEVKLILDSQEVTRQQVTDLAVTMQQSFRRVHERIDQVSVKPSPVCLAALATKAELAYVDGRVIANKGGVTRAWRAVQLTALVTVVVAAGFILEHQAMGIEALTRAWNKITGII